MINRRHLWIGLLVFVVGCGGMSGTAKRAYETPIAVNASVNPDVSFKSYRTWAWMPGLGDRFPESLIAPEALEGLAEAFKGEMFERGYTQVPDRADLMVNAHLAVDDINKDYIDDYYDGEYYPQYRDTNEKGPKKWEEGTLVIFIFDGGSKQLVWQGTAQTEVTDEMPRKERDAGSSFGGTADRRLR
jgi:hypothetical protein